MTYVCPVNITAITAKMYITNKLLSVQVCYSYLRQCNSVVQLKNFAIYQVVELIWDGRDLKVMLYCIDLVLMSLISKSILSSAPVCQQQQKKTNRLPPVPSDSAIRVVDFVCWPRSLRDCELKADFFARTATARYVIVKSSIDSSRCISYGYSPDSVRQTHQWFAQTRLLTQ